MDNDIPKHVQKTNAAWADLERSTKGMQAALRKLKKTHDADPENFRLRYDALIRAADLPDIANETFKELGYDHLTTRRLP